MSTPAETPAAPVTKFYHAENTNRFLVGPNKTKFSFDSYKVLAGNWRGVYRSSNPEEQAELDVMVADPKFGVKAITEAEYLAALQKKSPLVKDLKPLEPVNPQKPPPRVAELAAKVSASEEAAKDAKDKPAEVPEAEAVTPAPIPSRRRRNGASAEAVDSPAPVAAE